MNARNLAAAALAVVVLLAALAITVPATTDTVAGILAAGLLALPFVLVLVTVWRVSRARALSGAVRFTRHDVDTAESRRRARLAHRTIIDTTADVVFVEPTRTR